MTGPRWLASMMLGVGLALVAATAARSGEEETVQPRREAAPCIEAEPRPEAHLGLLTPFPCSATEGALDVIHIPPVVIMGDRLAPPRYPTDTRDPEFRKYLKRVRKRIDQEKAYPFTAQQMRWEGSTLIKFTVSPEGELLQIRIDRTSGHLILDEAAEAAVHKAFPVVPPKNLFAQPVEFKIPVMFELH